MKTKLVKDLMVPLSDYASVSTEATLSEAVATLRQSQVETDKKYPHLAILVVDEKKDVIGKITLLCILRSLEPKYDEMLRDQGSLHLGFTRSFVKMMLYQLKLWDAPMHDICKKAATKKVKTIMMTPDEREFIEEEASMDEAIHQIVFGSHQSLLVRKGGKVVGILKLTDVFEFVSDAIAACEL